MKERSICRRVREGAGELAAGPPPEVASHAAACPTCARVLRRQARLAELLRSVGEAPDADVPRPALRAARLAPLLGFRAAAAAAVLLGAALWWGARGERVRIDEVVDVADAPPPIDERLLALTAGYEAVAMRRPTESR